MSIAKFRSVVTKPKTAVPNFYILALRRDSCEHLAKIPAVRLPRIIYSFMQRSNYCIIIDNPPSCFVKRVKLSIDLTLPSPFTGSRVSM